MQFIRNLLAEQRKRAIGNLMRHIESQVYPSLSPTQRQELRAKVISAIGQYHDTCLDVLKASVDDGGMVNEEALIILTRLESALGEVRRQVVS